MVNVKVTPAEGLREILNGVSNEENDNIEGIVSLASNDKIDVAPSTSYNFHNPDNVKGADQNVTGNDDNVSNSTETTRQSQLTHDRLIHDLVSALNEQNYNAVSLPTTEKTFAIYLEKPNPPNNLGSQITWSNVNSSHGRQTQWNIIKDKTGVRVEVRDKKISFASLDAFFTKIMLNVIENNGKIDETMLQLQFMLAADSNSRYGYTTDKSFESMGTYWNDLHVRLVRTTASKH